MDLRVAIQGVAGCFHDAAAREYFAGQHVDTVPCETFTEMFDLLKFDASMLGIVAIENTIAGSLLQNHELLRQSNMTIVGEYKKYISHTICALPGQTLDDIVEVNSHPMALRQCEQYLHATAPFCSRSAHPSTFSGTAARSCITCSAELWTERRF